MYTTKRHVKKLYLFEKLHDLKSLVNDFSSTKDFKHDPLPKSMAAF